MLGKPFFNLCQTLQDARSFEDVADLLSNQLPPLVGSDDVSLIVFRNGPEVDSIYGHGAVAVRMRERMDAVNRLAAGHPLMGKVDFSKPGELGFAVSDFMDPGEYRETEFNRVVKGDLASEDAMFGRLVSGPTQQTLLTACRSKGAFKSANRQVFDVMLYTARAVLGRIASNNLEQQVMQYLLTSKGTAPNGFFILRGNREVLPLNNDAVQISESWWAEDEAVRELSEETMNRLRDDIGGAWIDPVTSRFTKVDLDLGGGMMKVFAIQKLSDEIILILPLPGGGGKVAESERAAAVLTKRQREIMDWIAEGKTSAEVAIILDISPRTVEKHLEAVFQRLGVENRIAAVRRYMDLKAGQPV